ncbi:hypothetical protein ACFV0L_40640 [Streptosporangium canum]|uniref:hypothetical protein n=1 Tax=Streptosporangium canum TaxID=324952 RepID=UPI003681C4BA
MKAHVRSILMVVSQVRDLDVALIGGPMEVAAIGQRIAFITDNLGNIIEPAGRQDRSALRPFPQVAIRP